MPHVLIIEDDQEIGELISFYLQKANIESLLFANAEEAYSALKESSLIILDINLPGMNGFTFLRQIRKENALPVIIVSALESDEDKINALGLGADDFVTKPFSPRVLIARVEAQLRRAALPLGSISDKITFGPFLLDKRATKLEREGCVIPLRKKEWDLLLFFVENSGKTLKPDEIFHQVWGNDYGDLTTVAVHVQRLRRKLGEDPQKPQFLETVVGFGYRFSYVKENS